MPKKRGFPTALIREGQGHANLKTEHPPRKGESLVNIIVDDGYGGRPIETLMVGASFVTQPPKQ